MTTEQKTQGTEELEEEPVSEETDSVSEKEEKPEGEEITFKNQAEFDAEIEKKVTSEANRIANKSTAPIQSENDKLKGEVAKLEREAIYKTEDSNLSRLEAAEQKDWGDTAETRLLQDVRREVNERGRKNEQQFIKLQSDIEEVKRIEHRQTAFVKAMKFHLPEDKEFISAVDTLTEQLNETDSEKEMDSIIKVEEYRLKAEAEAPKKKPKRPEPDGGLPTAPGGKSLKDLSPEERVTRGLEIKSKQK